MKGFFTLLSICLVVFCGQTAANERNLVRSHAHKALFQSRATDSGDGSLGLQIEAGILLGIDPNSKIIGVINLDLSLGALLDLGSNILGLFNLKDGGAILVDLATNLAQFIDFDALPKLPTLDDLKNVMDNLQNFISDKIDGFKNAIASGADMVFDFLNLLGAIAKGLNPFDFIKNVSQALADKLKAFANLFTQLATAFKNGIIQLGMGIMSVIAPLLNAALKVGSALASGIMNVLITLVQVKIDIIKTVLSNLIQILKSGATLALNALAAALRLVGTVFKTVQAALDAVAKGLIQKVKTVFDNIGSAITTALSTDFSWTVEISGPIDLIIQFSLSNGYLAFVNLAKGFTFLYAFGAGKYIVVNNKLGVGLLVNSLTKFANYVDTNAPEIANLFDTNQITPVLEEINKIARNFLNAATMFNVLLPNLILDANIKQKVQDAFGTILNFGLGGNTLTSMLANVVAGTVLNLQKIIDAAFGFALGTVLTGDIAKSLLAAVHSALGISVTL